MLYISYLILIARYIIPDTSLVSKSIFALLKLDYRDVCTTLNVLHIIELHP